MDTNSELKPDISELVKIEKNRKKHLFPDKKSRTIFIISLTVIIAGLFIGVPVAIHYSAALPTVKENGITYTLVKSKEAAISNYVITSCDSTCVDANIPTKVRGVEVRGILESAFKNCSALETVTIPGTIRKFEDNAFSDCISLKTVAIGEGVEIIPFEAFSNCYSLQSVVLPNTITTIWDKAFFDCKSLESIVIPESVQSIGDNALSSCSSIYTSLEERPRGWSRCMCDPNAIIWNYKG